MCNELRRLPAGEDRGEEDKVLCSGRKWKVVDGHCWTAVHWKDVEGT